MYSGRNEYALKDINFTLHRGEKIAFVGENGSGKTTIVKLMLRLYDPTEGEILLNGKSVSQYDYRDYLQMFSCAFQDYAIFAYSIRENIEFDHHDAERMERVLEQTGLSGVIDRCVDGVDMPLGKEFYADGVDLSGGEKQRIAIARAFYKAGAVAIFDEPTSALDALGEHNLYQEINGFCENRSGVFISHRMGSTAFCDMIYVLDRGKICEAGSHDELLNRRGVYYDMYRKQAEHYIG